MFPSFCAGDEVTKRVASRLARLWRQVRLGSAFVEFGIAALTVAFVAAPIVRRRASNAEEAELAVQRQVQRGFASSVAWLRTVGIIRLDSRGLAGLAEIGPCIVVANHPTLIDVVLLGSQLKQMDCIVNAGWTAHSPFLARAIDAAGYVRNDGGAAIVESCADRLRRGRRLLVFPEGTRSPQGGFGKFHRGSAHISLASGKPIVAVTIRAKPRMLGSKRKWYDVADRTSEFQLRIAGRLDPADYQREGQGIPLAARRMTEDLLSIYLQETDLADA
jgi:1-acyl-sn-glycerol-3-phosphate acyltransferase